VAPTRLLISFRCQTAIVEERLVGVFGFVIILVTISMIGKVLSEFAGNQRLPSGSTPSSDDVELLRDAVADMSTRLHKLEEERDFYRQLLEAPDDPPTRGLRSGRTGAADGRGNPDGSAGAAGPGDPDEDMDGPAERPESD
jgi:hypothetical protein